LGSGLNAGNIGAEIDVIQPGLPAQPHAPIAIRFAPYLKLSRQKLRN
jgi:hypothetical protein